MEFNYYALMNNIVSFINPNQVRLCLQTYLLYYTGKWILQQNITQTKQNYEEFDNFVECWIYSNSNENNDVKVKVIAVLPENIETAHKKCNINLNLNRKIPVVFRCVFQELGAFNFNTNVMPKTI